MIEDAMAGFDEALVRDATNRDGGTLVVSAAAWQAFTGEIR